MVRRECTRDENVLEKSVPQSENLRLDVAVFDEFVVPAVAMDVAAGAEAGVAVVAVKPSNP